MSGPEPEVPGGGKWGPTRRASRGHPWVLKARRTGGGGAQGANEDQGVCGCA